MITNQAKMMKVTFITGALAPNITKFKQLHTLKPIDHTFTPFHKYLENNEMPKYENKLFSFLSAKSFPLHYHEY